MIYSEKTRVEESFVYTLLYVCLSGIERERKKKPGWLPLCFPSDLLLSLSFDHAAVTKSHIHCHTTIHVFYVFSENLALVPYSFTYEYIG